MLTLSLPASGLPDSGLSYFAEGTFPARLLVHITLAFLLMSAPSMLIGLAGKLNHGIPDIRDRAMKALCLKLLSPLCEEKTVEELSRIPGLAHSFLQWLNDRYDSVTSEFVQDCLSVIKKLVSESDAMRCLFIDAGGPSFLDDFGTHNVLFSDKCKSLVSLLLCLEPVADKPHAIRCEEENRSQPSHSAMNPTDDEKIFDLAVRIKFSTSKTPLKVLRELSNEVRFGFCLSIEPNYLLVKPYILESLLDQLSCTGPSSSPVSDFSHFSQAIMDILHRLPASDQEQSEFIPVMIVKALESILSRPTYIEVSKKILDFSLTRCDLSRLPTTDLELIGSVLHRLSLKLFTDELYREEKFTFADGSSVSLRKLIEWDSLHRTVAEVMIEIVNGIAHPETVWVFSERKNILRCITEWISDECFYTSSDDVEAAKLLASKAAVGVATLDSSVTASEFLRAREMTICLKKTRKTGQLFGDSDG